MAVAEPDYPAHRASDVVLRDGSTVHIRPVQPTDAATVERLLRGLSERSRWLRFFSGFPDLVAAVRWAVEVDYRTRYGLVATAGADGGVVAHAVFQRDPDRPERAEVAFAVADRFQGRGLGTILLGQLAEAASAAGVRVFTAEVLPDNHQMVRVFRSSGFPVEIRALPGRVAAELPTSLSPAALEQFERREQVAAVAAVQAVLAPRSVAVIGASRRRGTIGGELFHNLLSGGFQGPVYPVNPNAPVVQSVLAYPSVTEVPGEVDLAVVAVPAAAAVGVARQCVAKGVRALVVVSAGFAEAGPEGAERQAELLDVCRQAGMRLVGPNCLGVVNTAPGVRLHATYAPRAPVPGRVGFLSQSGALGLAVVDYVGALGIGLSSFVSVGNKADLSGNDLLDYWEQDADTSVVLLYLESFGNPRRFARVARRVGRTKPVVATKSGASVAGARPSSSHTGALLADADVTVDALFRQAGVIRTDTLAELFDVAALLGNQPRPAGPRVGIVTNGRGPGVLCADACQAGGLRAVELSAALQERLADGLEAGASTANPVDLLAPAPAGAYRRAVELLAASGEVDAVIAIFIPPLLTEPGEVAAAVRDAAAAAGRRVPVLAVFMFAAHGPAELEADDGGRVPAYRFPEDAARALARAAAYGAFLDRPEEPPPALPDVRRDEAAGVVAAALADAPGWLGPDQVARLLGCYGLPLAARRLAGTPEEAAAAAAALGGPVVLKAVAPTLLHKHEAGGVRLGLDEPAAVRAAAAELAAAAERAGHPVACFLVQEMPPDGVELLVGVVGDPLFGPLVACAASSAEAELLKDVAVRITPLTRTEAAGMVHSLATFPLLQGYRGGPPADVAGLIDVLVRVGALVDDHPEIAELDCDPVRVLPDRVVIVDARVRVEAAPPPRPLGARPA